MNERICPQCGSKHRRMSNAGHMPALYCSKKCQLDTQADQRKSANVKKISCVFARCKKHATRKTPEGDNVCRSHLAHRNMFGSLDASSPTVASTGKGQYRTGFMQITAREESSAFSEEQRKARAGDRRKTFLRRKKFWFELSEHQQAASNGKPKLRDWRIQQSILKKEEK